MQNLQISHLVSGTSICAFFLSCTLSQPPAPAEMILGGWAGSAQCQDSSLLLPAMAVYGCRARS